MNEHNAAGWSEALTEDRENDLRIAAEAIGLPIDTTLIGRIVMDLQLDDLWDLDDALVDYAKELE